MTKLLEKLGLKLPVGLAPPPPRAESALPPPPATTGTAAVATGAVVPPTATPPSGGTPTPPVAPPVPVATQLAAIDTALTAAKADVAALKTDKLKASLTKEIETLAGQREKIGQLAATAAAVVVVPALAKAKELQTRCAELKAGEPAALTQQANWAIANVTALTTLINAQPAQAKTIMTPALENVKKKLPNLKWQIEKGDFKASEALASAIFYACANATKAVNSFAADFPAYKVERDKAEKAIKQLKSHAQVEQIKAEIETLEQDLVDADGVASKADLKGWEKATAAVKIIPELAARAKKMADELAKVATKLPALTKQFKDAGADGAASASMARYAIKMLVEEKCTEAEAVKMAKDASGFVKAGLQETDALMSARVKKSLLASGTPEAVAQEIGKNLRAGGTSTAEDAKAVADGMKKFPKAVLENLNKNGIQTECCRGAVTEAMPELKGVLPQGWPAGSTWDSVPGVYNGSVKKVLVGTMEKDGKRHVPGPNEGPVKHGTPNLIGHEGGHAFDAADGPLKSKNAAFLKARDDDKALGSPTGLFGHRDDYFLTHAEGGTNDNGATSETFAESFAMHLGTSPKWPKLEAFWVANPWGA
jgi:hypothetical protein